MSLGHCHPALVAIEEQARLRPCEQLLPRIEHRGGVKGTSYPTY